MASLLRLPRLAVGALTLSAAAPVVVMEWRDLVQERDALRGELADLRAERARWDAAPMARTPAAGDSAELSYAGEPLADVGSAAATAAEERTVLQAEAAALRRQLEAARGAGIDWERSEGGLDMSLAGDDGSAGSAAEAELVTLQEEGTLLRRRLQASDRDMEEVQLERDEALDQLRREMFTNLQYSAIIGECGRRTSQRGFDECADGVREALRPHWRRFESCVRNYNAIPAYVEPSQAKKVSNVIRLDRGAVLMCDPGLPEGGAR